MRNLLSTVPKGAQDTVAAIVRTVFFQPDHQSAMKQLHEVARMLSPKFPQATELLQDAAEDVLAHLQVGTTSPAGPGRFWNSALVVDPAGRVVGAYDKVRPVPFGEYVPGRRYLGFVTALQAVPRDMVPGPGPRALPVPGGLVGTPISYEVAFAGIVRGFAERGAELIVVPTNTSSHGPDAPVAEQELQLTRLRAVELGLWVVQAAPSGISAIVDPDGRVVARTGLYEAEILTGDASGTRGRASCAGGKPRR